MRFDVGALLLAVALAMSGIPAYGATAYPTPLVPPIIPDDVKSLTVTSTSFSNGGTIPFRYVSCGTSSGQPGNVSPQISWTPGPPDTKSYVVTIFDTDAPTGVGFHHWDVFNIPPDVTSLPEDATKNMIAGAMQGYTDAGSTGYRGPCPPVGDPPHHYYITVSALSTVLPNVGPQTTGTWIDFMLSKATKILARGQYVGLYGR
jgi:Raf kinase inhibitor-like YbhB/YbcL family protein